MFLNIIFGIKWNKFSIIVKSNYFWNFNIFSEFFLSNFQCNLKGIIEFLKITNFRTLNWIYFYF